MIVSEPLLSVPLTETKAVTNLILKKHLFVSNFGNFLRVRSDYSLEFYISLKSHDHMILLTAEPTLYLSGVR